MLSIFQVKLLNAFGLSRVVFLTTVAQVPRINLHSSNWIYSVAFLLIAYSFFSTRVANNKVIWDRCKKKILFTRTATNLETTLAEVTPMQHSITNRYNNYTAFIKKTFMDNFAGGNNKNTLKSQSIF